VLYAHPERCIRIQRIGFQYEVVAVVPFEGFGIELVHAPEATELALATIPIAVVVEIAGGELALADLVDHLHAVHHLYREW